MLLPQFPLQKLMYHLPPERCCQRRRDWRLQIGVINGGYYYYSRLAYLRIHQFPGFVDKTVNREEGHKLVISIRVLCLLAVPNTKGSRCVRIIRIGGKDASFVCIVHGEIIVSLRNLIL